MATRMIRRVLPFLAVGVLAPWVLGNAPASAGESVSTSAAFSATAAAPGASGAAKFIRVGGSRAKLRIKVSGLDPHSTYKVLAEGLNVGSLTTNTAGRGRIRFRAGTRRARSDLPLDFDPWSLSVVAEDGTEVLNGEIDDTGAPEPSPSVSPSVSPFDGDNQVADDEPSPTASPSVSPVEGGDGDGDAEDEPSPTASASASVNTPGEEGGDPSPTTSPSVSAEDVSPSVSDDEVPSVSPSPSPEDPEPSMDNSGPGSGDDDDSGASDDDDSTPSDDDDNSGPGSGDDDGSNSGPGGGDSSGRG